MKNNKSKFLMFALLSVAIILSIFFVSAADTIAPVITINGLNSVNVIQGSTYVDAGATALDAVDGVIVVITTGTVDTTIIGTYTLTYTATDLSSNTATATRTVNVLSADSNPTAPVLGEAGRFVIFSNTIVTTTGVTAISNGDIGITTYARSTYGGFTPAGSEGAFTELTNGLSYASDDANPSPFPYPLHYSTIPIGAQWTTTQAMLTQSATDLGIAYTFLAADPNPTAPTQVLPTELGGVILTRGVYKTASDVTIGIANPGNLTLDAQGNPDSIFIFSIDGTFTTGDVATGSSINLINGAQAKNVYWRVAGVTAIGKSTIFYGNIFNWAQINVLNGASVTGRLFSANEQVTLDANTVTFPPIAPPVVPPVVIPPPAPADTSTPTTSSGGGHVYGCSTQWTCTDWTSCADGTQTRTCSYAPNKCTPTSAKPIQSQSCAITPAAATTSPTNDLNSAPITGGVTGVVNTIKGITVGAWVVIVLIIAIISTFIILLIKGSHRR